MRLQFLAARAALARAEERRNDARRDLRTAIDVARTAERKLDELDLRLQMVDLERSGANTALVTGVARVVAEEAASRGLEGLGGRAPTPRSGGRAGARSAPGRAPTRAVEGSPARAGTLPGGGWGEGGEPTIRCQLSGSVAP